jgi:hypothetical protein
MPPAGRSGVSRSGNRRRAADLRKIAEIGTGLQQRRGTSIERGYCPGARRSFVRQDQVAEVHRRGFNNGALDLAVEVVWPSNTLPELKHKIRQDFKAGCHTVWMLDQDRHEVHVFEASGNTAPCGRRFSGVPGTPRFPLPVADGSRAKVREHRGVPVSKENALPGSALATVPTPVQRRRRTLPASPSRTPETDCAGG